MGAGPGNCAIAILGTITAASLFWDIRKSSDIKGENRFCFAADPSIMCLIFFHRRERIEDVSMVNSHWIPGDESDDPLDRTPSSPLSMGTKA